MKMLLEITKERIEKEKELLYLKKKYEENEKELKNKLTEIKRKESLLSNDLNLEKIEIAETILNIYGNPFNLTDGGKKSILEYAIEDVTNDFVHLRKMYFGNKRYEGYYQRNDHPYGYSPNTEV